MWAVALFHLINLGCDVNKAVNKNKFHLHEHTIVRISHGPLDPTCTHIFLVKPVHLSQKPLLAVGVGGQEVGGEGESVGDDLVASDEKEEGLAHDLVHGQRLGRVTGLVFLRRIRRAFMGEDLCDDVKALHAHGGGRMTGIQDHLEEVSPPLRDKRRNAHYGPGPHKWGFLEHKTGREHAALGQNKDSRCGMI